MNRKRAVIFGVTGQDGSYLSELLLNKRYEVIGVSRRSSVNNKYRLKSILNDEYFKLVSGDVTDAGSVYSIINEYKPTEVYNLAAQSHVGDSFTQPNYTFNVVASGCINILEAIKSQFPESRFYQASSSEMFGSSFSRVSDSIKWQDENTMFSPQSPYAIAKVAAHEAVKLYRKAYKLHASSGILFNHESERRGEEFVTRKITKYIGNLKRHLDKHPDVVFPLLKLGNLDASRDWGYAPEYVYAMWLMLQQKEPDDYIIATGLTKTVREFLDEGFSLLNYDYTRFIQIDPNLIRPAEVDFLRGDYTKAKNKLGWQPSVMFRDLVKKMVNHDIKNEQ